MKFNRISVLFSLILVISTFFSSLAFAEEISKPNLVALGDSITFGLNLEDPTTQAFPNVIGNSGFNVTNLSESGLTSDDLKAKVIDPANALAIQNADVFTLYIGGNDLLGATGIKDILKSPTPVTLTPELQQQITQAAINTSQQLTANLTQIIGGIRQQNTKAPIILYNLYNPIGDSNENPYVHLLHTVGEQIIQEGNGVIPGFNELYRQFANIPGIYLADAYSAFDGHQADFILPLDIHPTRTGHQALAAIGTEILLSLVPKEITIDLTASTTEKTKDPVTINVSTSAEEVLEMKWLPGEKAIDEFDNAGTPVTDNMFQVTENGTYTVYVLDGTGAQAVKSITISNIKKEEPAPNPNPNPNDTGNQNTTPTPTTPTTTTTPSTTSATPTTVKTTTTKGHTLPNTATPIFNSLAIGLGLILAGLAVMKFQQFRRKENI